MTKVLRIVTYPIRSGQAALLANTRLWQTTFWETWRPIPLDEKMTWIAFVGQTIGILTLIELLLLKK